MKKLGILLLVIMVGFFQYCSSSKKSSSTSSMPAKVSVTYVANIQPLVSEHCSPCHIPPKGFKKALNTYDAAKTNIDDMIRRIQMNPTDKGFMPFKHAKLSDSTISVFVQWKAGGLAEK